MKGTLRIFLRFRSSNYEDCSNKETVRASKVVTEILGNFAESICGTGLESNGVARRQILAAKTFIS